MRFIPPEKNLKVAMILGMAYPASVGGLGTLIGTLLAFGLSVLAWITRNEPFGGWSGLLHINSAGDSTVGLNAVVAMFLAPNGKGERLLDWKTTFNIPWGMLNPYVITSMCSRYLWNEAKRKISLYL